MAEEENQRATLAEEEEYDESDTESEPENFESERDHVAENNFPPGSAPAISNPIHDPSPSVDLVSGQNGGGILAAPVSSASPPSGGGERRVVSLEDSRKLFQRLWTDEEEIVMLRGFLEFTTKRGTTFASHQYDTGPFYDEIKRKLKLDFSKNQLIEKLRRLKKKYRNCASRMRSKGKNFSFRSTHEEDVFEIAKHIWQPSNKRDSVSGNLSGEEDAGNDVAPPPVSKRHRNRNKRKSIQDDSETFTLTGTVPVPPPPPPPVPVPLLLPLPGIEANPAVHVPLPVPGIETNLAVPVPVPVPEPVQVPVPHVPVSSSSSSAVIEETLRTCLSPLFKELIGSAIGAGPVGAFGIGPMPVCPPGNSGGEKWRQQYILELEVYLRRIELVKEQTVLALEELRRPKS